MRPADTPTRWHTGNESRSIKMGIARDDAEVFTILTLTNLYSDKIMAVVREYSTNARDSHLEAGNNNPIQITLPTVDSPQFVVTDYGVGLSEEELAGIYALYGASTKRQDEHATGMLGLGCKAALTYSVSFMLEATQDGITTLADISKGDDGVGVINILSSIHTGKPNGVEVTVPVALNDIFIFRAKVEQFFFYWREGVLIDDEPPLTIDDDKRGYQKVDDDVYVRLNIDYRDNDSMYVQGGVAYPVPPPADDKDIPLVAYMPMGSIDFVPSREAVHHTPRTDESIATTKSWLREIWNRHIRDDVAVLNDFERIKFFHRLPRFLVPRFGNKKGSRPEWAKLGLEMGFSGRKAYHVSGGYGSLGKKASHFRNDWTDDDEMRWVVDFPFKGFVSSHRERLDEHGVQAPFVVLPDTFKVDTGTFPHVIHWGDVPKLQKQLRLRGKRTETLYTCYFNDQYQSAMAAFPDNAKLTYIHGLRGNDYTIKASAQSRVIRDVWFVKLASRQVSRFTRIYPDSLEFDEWHSIEQLKAHDGMTEPDRLWNLAHYEHQALSTLFHEYRDFIDNPHFTKLLLEVSKSNSQLLERLNHFGWPDNAKVNYATSRTTDIHGPDFKTLRNEYPLLMQINRYSHKEHIEDLVLYINAKAELYEGNQNGN